MLTRAPRSGAAPEAARPAARRLRDDRGGALTLTVVFAAVLFMMFGLVTDGGRAYAERQRLQNWLDSLAVAVAAQLDGRPDALIRAQWVADNAGIAAASAFSRAGLPGEPAAGEAADAAFAVERTLFLHAAPEDGLASLSEAEIEALATNDPAEAAFALLYAAPRRVPFSALALISDAAARGAAFAVTARSLAMPVPRARCAPAQLAVCTPPDLLDQAQTPGVQMRLRKNLDGQWAPGEYGAPAAMTDLEDGFCETFSGVQRLICLLAITPPEGECPASVDILAGDGIDVSAALNTRFDIWDAAASHLRGAPEVPSDANTIKGALHTCTGARFDAVSDSMGLPDDPCFHLGTCDFISPPATADALDVYWDQNHGGNAPSEAATRHDLYLAEIAGGLLDPEGPEDSRAPQCNPAAAPVAERRMLDLALIDCTALSGLAPSGAPVLGRVQALMTAPATRSANAIITFDGAHQNVFMQPGDILMQAPAAGDLGSSFAIGAAGGTSSGVVCWGGPAPGVTDPAACATPPWPAGDARRLDLRGRLTYDPYRALGLMRITARPSVSMGTGYPWKTVPMLFDTANPTGGDSDLASTRFGNVLIVSEDGDAKDPDDQAKGGWLVFHFDRPTRIESLVVFDTELGGVIRLYDYVEPAPHGEFKTVAGSLVPLRSGEVHDPGEMARFTVPTLGDGKHVKVYIGRDGVRTLAYFLPDSGAIDDLEFSNALTAPLHDDTVMLEVVRPREGGGDAWAVLFD